MIDLARCLAALSPSFAQTPNLPSAFLDSCNWGQSSTDSKAKDTNTLLALRGISNLSATRLGRQALGRDAGEVLNKMGSGGWGEGGKWKVAAATVALKYVHDTRKGKSKRLIG